MRPIVNFAHVEKFENGCRKIPVAHTHDIPALICVCMRCFELIYFNLYWSGIECKVLNYFFSTVSRVFVIFISQFIPVAFLLSLPKLYFGIAGHVYELGVIKKYGEYRRIVYTYCIKICVSHVNI